MESRYARFYNAPHCSFGWMGAVSVRGNAPLPYGMLLVVLVELAFYIQLFVVVYAEFGIFRIVQHPRSGVSGGSLKRWLIPYFEVTMSR